MAGIDEAAEAGHPMTEEYTDPRTGRIHRRRRRGLSNGSINKVLAAVRMVLKEGKRHGWIEQNPLGDSDCFLPQNAPRRSSWRSRRSRPCCGPHTSSTVNSESSSGATCAQSANRMSG